MFGHPSDTVLNLALSKELQPPPDAFTPHFFPEPGPAGTEAQAPGPGTLRPVFLNQGGARGFSGCRAIPGAGQGDLWRSPPA